MISRTVRVPLGPAVGGDRSSLSSSLPKVPARAAGPGDPRVIGRFVDVTASPQQVTVFCDGQVVAQHDRSWAKHGVVTDPAHTAAAARMRQALAEDRQRRQAATRHHADGHAVALRALPDYDALFGVDFTNPTTKASNE
jgi:hypothetical protein